jgi:hypothetical protein
VELGRDKRAKSRNQLDEIPAPLAVYCCSGAFPISDDEISAARQSTPAVTTPSLQEPNSLFAMI